MTVRRKLLAGNWKMHKTQSSARADFATLNELLKTKPAILEKADVGIAAPAVFLSEMSSLRSPVGVYAQNCHWAAQGAFTGEISASMLANISCTGSLVAHSERRQMNGETNQTAGTRMGALLSAGLQAIYCVGETLEQRESGQVYSVLRSQIEESFAASGIRFAFQVLGANPVSPLLSVAYEPVWAIGTGRAATPEQAADAHAFIRSVLAEVLGDTTAQKIRILYGGSVTAANASGFLSAPHVDGALVGGASLDVAAFANLAQIAVTL